MKKLLLLMMSFTLVLYSSVSSARNPDIKASVNAMMYINNLRSSDFQKLTLPQSVLKKNPGEIYYALKDTPRSRLLGLLSRFEFQNIDSGDLTPSVPNYSSDFVQISYSLLNNKGICVSFVSALAEVNLGTNTGFRAGQQMWRRSNLQQGTILATKPKPGRSGHIVLLMQVRTDYIWVLDQNAYYKEGGVRGIVGIHKLFFKSGSIKSTDMTDARNYYTVYKK